MISVPAMPKKLFISVLSFVVAMGIAMPASASGGGKDKPKKQSNQFEAKFGKEGYLPDDLEIKDVGQFVDLPFLLIPVTMNGKFRTYAFVSVRLLLKDNVDVWAVRAKTHFMKDAIVRMASNGGIAYDTKDMKLDTGHLRQMIEDGVYPWVSRDLVTKIEFTKLELQG